MIEQLQGTEQWFADRRGKVTASRIADVMAGGKGITRTKYAAILAAERMTGKTHRQSFRSFSMEHGNEFEAVAAMEYELRTGTQVELCGIIDHPLIPWAAASPDRLTVCGEGLVEIKCPETHTFFGYALNQVIPSDYRYQMLWQMACTGRKWCDWVAYDPDLPDEDNLLVIRFEPKRSEIEELEREVLKFNAEVNVMMKALINRRK